MRETGNFFSCSWWLRSGIIRLGFFGVCWERMREKVFYFYFWSLLFLFFCSPG